MRTFIIGDIQGCFDEFQTLLEKINFNPKQDKLCCCGDLINRGPKSLETLRYLKALNKPPIIILGNHDLHALAIFYADHKSNPHDTLDALFNAPDCPALMDWLRHQKVCHYDEKHKTLIIHAGVSPKWDLKTTLSCALELENTLKSDTHIEFYQQMYGNEPNQWDEQLIGIDRLRYITNTFTRLRFCHPDQSYDLSFKGRIEDHTGNVVPWYHILNSDYNDKKIIFGHWAALGGKTECQNAITIDTGCVWGESLTAYELETGQSFSVPAQS